MTRLEKCKLFEEKGFKYNPETGDITSHKGKVTKPDSWGYIHLGIGLNGKTVGLFGHHFAWWMSYHEVPDEDLVIDHIDRDQSNNKISNLRSITQKNNVINSDRIENCLGYYFHKPTGKWRGRIYIEGKLKHLGLFDTKEKARAAYLAALKFYYPDRYETLKNINKL
jgi:hypothetical protein